MSDNFLYSYRFYFIFLIFILVLFVYGYVVLYINKFHDNVVIKENIKNSILNNSLYKSYDKFWSAFFGLVGNTPFDYFIFFFFLYCSIWIFDLIPGINPFVFLFTYICIIVFMLFVEILLIILFWLFVVFLVNDRERLYKFSLHAYIIFYISFIIVTLIFIYIIVLHYSFLYNFVFL